MKRKGRQTKGKGLETTITIKMEKDKSAFICFANFESNIWEMKISAM